MIDIFFGWLEIFQLYIQIALFFGGGGGRCYELDLVLFVAVKCINRHLIQ